VSIAAASLARYVARCVVRTSHKTRFVVCNAVNGSQGAPSCRQNRKLIDAHDVVLFFGITTGFAMHIEIEKGNYFVIHCKHTKNATKNNIFRRIFVLLFVLSLIISKRSEKQLGRRRDLVKVATLQPSARRKRTFRFGKLATFDGYKMIGH
jgi:hypothetical protein